jgi:hypothetical protein
VAGKLDGQKTFFMAKLANGCWHQAHLDGMMLYGNNGRHRGPNLGKYGNANLIPLQTSRNFAISKKSEGM